MKTLIVIAAFLLSAATKLLAQEHTIEIKRANHSFGTITKNHDSTSSQSKHEFEIVANEDLEVDLKFNLKTEDNLNVVVKDKRNKIVLSKKFQKKGENRIEFAMEEDQKYTVLLDGEKQSNLIVDISKK